METKAGQAVKARFLIAVAATLAIAVSEISTEMALAQGTTQYNFLVGVTNRTTTPAQGDNHPEGQIEIQCGLEWRVISKNPRNQYSECYPSTATDPFDLTYKARLADDASGNPVYHSGTVAISCTRGSDDPAVPNATSATVVLTGSGTGITASNVICTYPRSQQQPGNGD